MTLQYLQYLTVYITQLLSVFLTCVFFKYREKPSFEAFFIKNTQGICCKINFNSNSSLFDVWFCFSFLPEAHVVFFSGLQNKIDFDFRYGVCITLGTTVGFAAIVDFFAICLINILLN